MKMCLDFKPIQDDVDVCVLHGTTGRRDRSTNETVEPFHHNQRDTSNVYEA